MKSDQENKNGVPSDAVEAETQNNYLIKRN
jgi:hypothetical protein